MANDFYQHYYTGGLTPIEVAWPGEYPKKKSYQKDKNATYKGIKEKTKTTEKQRRS